MRYPPPPSPMPMSTNGLQGPPQIVSGQSNSNSGPAASGGGGHHVLPGGGKRNSRQLANNSSSKDSARCSGCNQPIRDQFLLYSDDKYWHHRCLVCDTCGMQLGGGHGPGSYFTKGGLNLCKSDYLRLASGHCYACKGFVPASTYVVKITASLIYHPHCLSCSLCNQKLRTGDKFVLSKDGKQGIICTLHTPQAAPSNMGPSTTTSGGPKSKAKQKFKPPPPPAQ